MKELEPHPRRILPIPHPNLFEDGISAEEAALLEDTYNVENIIWYMDKLYSKNNKQLKFGDNQSTEDFIIKVLKEFIEHRIAVGASALPGTKPIGTNDNNCHLYNPKQIFTLLTDPFHWWGKEENFCYLPEAFVSKKAILFWREVYDESKSMKRWLKASAWSVADFLMLLNNQSPDWDPVISIDYKGASFYQLLQNDIIGNRISPLKEDCDIRGATFIPKDLVNWAHKYRFDLPDYMLEMIQVKNREATIRDAPSITKGREPKAATEANKRRHSQRVLCLSKLLKNEKSIHNGQSVHRKAVIALEILDDRGESDYPELVRADNGEPYGLDSLQRYIRELEAQKQD